MYGKNIERVENVRSHVVSRIFLDIIGIENQAIIELFDKEVKNIGYVEKCNILKSRYFYGKEAVR